MNTNDVDTQHDPRQGRADETFARYPEHQGCAEAMEQAQAREELEIVSRRLAEANAWINDDALARDTSAHASLHATLQFVEDVQEDVVVARVCLHGPWIALGGHQDDRQAGIGRHAPAAPARAAL